MLAGVASATLPQMNGNLTIEEIQSRGYFDLALEFNQSSHLWMLPVYLGFREEDLKNPYWCALDFTLPSVLVPNVKCLKCDGQKYKTPDNEFIVSDSFLYPHKMSYW